MYTLFVIGNIASGKSAACRYLASLGGQYIDLDELAKSLYVPGSDLVFSVAESFGWDVLQEDGSINKVLLASRAFSDECSAHRLNELVHPYLLQQLGLRLVPENCCTVMKPSYPFTVVEVSVPRSIEDAFALADDVVAISAPLDVRRQRALLRGMDAHDFDNRSSLQPSEDELASMANVVIDNTDATDTLFNQLRALLEHRGVILKDEGSVHGEDLS